MADGIGFKSEFTYSSAPPSDNHPSMYLPGEYPSAPHPIPCFEQPYPQVPQPPLPTYPTNCFPEESKPVFALFPHIDYPTPSHPQEDSDITAGGHKAYYWIDWSSDRMVPPTAVHGGVDKDGSQIYVGRAYHEGDWIPAKVIPERHTAYVAYGGGEHSKDTFQILCEQRFDWVPTSSGHIPSGAVEGGRTQSGEPLYIGRVWHDGAHTVGKIHPSHGCCYIPYDSQEMSFCDYEILVLRH
ncbi:hypothetical protein RN001_005005 [Aquatica leii]|uniref:Uncharacterized protein n=1 Tax=Aquatica leii TaxID=1421715 RepID=A0AAN7SAC8_9COLE|nr:hypothetical protein RN001_005005 [Aquatica leii]